MAARHARSASTAISACSRRGQKGRAVDRRDEPTQGDADWMLVRPWLQVPSNCVAPRGHVERILNQNFEGGWDPRRAGGIMWRDRNRNFRSLSHKRSSLIPFYGFEYDVLNEAPNGGRGFFADLEGNELPNAPHLTTNIGAQYTFFVDNGDWELTFRGDYYRQSKSFARVYNTEYRPIEGMGQRKSGGDLRTARIRPGVPVLYQERLQ